MELWIRNMFVLALLLAVVPPVRAANDNLVYGVVTALMVLIVLAMAATIGYLFKYDLDLCMFCALLRTNFSDLMFCRYKQPIENEYPPGPSDPETASYADRRSYEDTFGELPPVRPLEPGTPDSSALGGGIPTESMLDLVRQVSSSEDDDDVEDLSADQNPPEPTSSVPVTEYVRNYGSKNIDQTRIRKEFEMLATWSKNLVRNKSHAKLEKNRPKNRYFDIVPYNYNRVPLYGSPNTKGPAPYTSATAREQRRIGYINASYIHEYGSPQPKYIAAQGPLARSLRDFWEMVWQEGSDTVVMLTTLREQGKVKCEQYWPKEKGDLLDFGEIRVTLEVSQCYAFYDYRIVIVQRGNVTRKVHHFLYHHWPDKEAPDMVVPILDLYHKVFDCQSVHPLVIHCSAGVGRTGTFIALDYLLHEAKQMGTVDVQRCVYELRRQRGSMVQKVSQYMFVYEALHEALEAKQTMVRAASFSDWYCEAQKNPEDTIVKHFQMVRKKCPDETEEAEGKLKENLPKNRDQKIIPADVKRPFLITYMKGRTNYINAVYVDGFLETNSIIVTQLPFEKTVEDIWRLIYDRNCTAVLLLDPPDETASQYWPKDNEKKLYGKTISVQGGENESLSTNTVSVRSYSVVLTQQPDYNVEVTILQLKTWPIDNPLPPNKLHLVDLINLWRKYQKHSSIVQCTNGATKSGIFCACSYIVDQIQTDHEVDIYHACRMVTASRPQFIQSEDQYRLLHEFAIEFLHTFDDYSNFSDVGVMMRTERPIVSKETGNFKKAPRRKPPSIRSHSNVLPSNGDITPDDKKKNDIYVNSADARLRHSMSSVKGVASERPGVRSSLPVPSAIHERPSKPPRASLEARALLDPVSRLATPASDANGGRSASGLNCDKNKDLRTENTHVYIEMTKVAQNSDSTNNTSVSPE